MYVHVCIYVNHFAADQKLIHCKLTILELKKKNPAIIHIDAVLTSWLNILIIHKKARKEVPTEQKTGETNHGNAN